MSVQLQCAPSRDAWSCDTNRHSSFNKSPSLPCVESKHLTHSLASEVTTNSLLAFWLTSLTCLASGNPCCAVYTCSCPVWANWACLTSWPPQPSLEQSASLSCTGASGCPVGGVRDIELCWRALLLCNLYKHTSECTHVYVSHFVPRLFSATPCTVIALSLSFLPVRG